MTHGQKSAAGMTPGEGLPDPALSPARAAMRPITRADAAVTARPPEFFGGLPAFRTCGGAVSGPLKRPPRFLASLLCLCFLAMSHSFGSFPAKAAMPGKLELERPALDLDWSSIEPDPAPSGGGNKNLVFRKDRLFGTVEFRSKIKNMPKWERVLKIYGGKKSIDHAFQAVGRQREGAAWEKLKASVANAGTLEKAKAVNVFFNQWPYRHDRAVYGVSDYWATPDEFIKNSGDCEDYAIAKFFALKQLGVNPSDMRLVILKDSMRNIDHAVLALYIGKDVYILDNVTKMVLSHDNFKHYRPFFSVDEVYRWAHVPPAN